MEELSAKNLKIALWETLDDLKKKKIQPAEADSISTVAREILRTTNTQLRISAQSKRDVASDVIAFAEK